VSVGPGDGHERKGKRESETQKTEQGTKDQRRKNESQKEREARTRGGDTQNLHEQVT